MISAYILWGHDNDSEMFSDFEPLSHVSKCDSCGFRIDYKQTNNLFKIIRKVYDFSFTLDGIAIASLRFKEFCIRNNYNNITFKELEGSFGFYQIIIQNSLIPFSAREIEELCVKCGQFNTVIGPKANIETLEEPLKDGFYQSDLTFGSRLKKHVQPLTPLIVVAPITKEKMRKEKLKGLIFEPI
jgi:hypothetical protein